MPINTLIDTGAMLAFMDEDDRWHDACSDALTRVQMPLLTSQAVLTELFHFIATRSYRLETAWKFVLSGTLQLGEINDADLPALARLMHQYHDRPMDFADATLVHLAQRHSLSTILTVDVADFQTYRIGGQKRFRILPDPSLR